MHFVILHALYLWNIQPDYNIFWNILSFSYRSSTFLETLYVLESYLLHEMFQKYSEIYIVKLFKHILKSVYCRTLRNIFILKFVLAQS